MKVVVAIIKPFKLSDVHDALHAIGINELTICEAKRHRHKKGHSEVCQPVEYAGHYLLRLRVEVIVSEEFVEQVVEAICSAARTGERGDGKIYVHSVEQVIRIRTGEKSIASPGPHASLDSR